MDQIDLTWFKGILELKQSELSATFRNRGDIVIENVADALDHVQMMGERELAVRNLDRDSGMLRQVRRAIARIATGTFAVCARCEEDIAAKRLAAVPWASFCIKCQEHIDRQQAEGGDEIAELYEAAA